jgi:fluoride exporter
MRTVVAIGVAGSFGAVVRYGVEGFVSERTNGSFPWGTFVVNISGSIILGLLFALLIEGRVIMAPWLRTAATVGLIGAYTTFSTLSLETFRMIEDGAYLAAGFNAFGSLALGLVAVWVGIVAGRMI